LNIFSRSKKAPHIVIVLKTNPGRATWKHDYNVVWKNSHANQSNFVKRTWTLMQLPSTNGSKAPKNKYQWKSKRTNICGFMNIMPAMIAKSKSYIWCSKNKTEAQMGKNWGYIKIISMMRKHHISYKELMGKTLSETLLLKTWNKRKLCDILTNHIIMLKYKGTYVISSQCRWFVAQHA
jgi:hypothetical protein